MLKRGQLGAILFVIVVALVMIGGLIFLGRLVMGGNHGAKQTINQTGQDFLIKPDNKTRITMSVRGPIVAREQHYQIEISISPAKRELHVYKGYDKTNEVNKIELDNDQAAFDNLALALDRAGFLNSKQQPVRDAGACSAGQLIDYKLAIAEKEKYQAWTTSCGDAGNFSGHNNQVIELLLGQIPDAKNQISQIKQSFQLQFNNQGL